MSKPHWAQTFVRDEERERVITHSAVVPHERGEKGLLRVWMELVWLLPTNEAEEKRLLDERTCYYWQQGGTRYATLERCLAEALLPEPAPVP